MYRNFFKRCSTLLKSPSLYPFISLSLLTLFSHPTHLQSQSKTLRQHITSAYNAQQQMKKIIQVDVCKSQQIKQGQVFPIRVKNYNGQDYLILIIRIADKLFAVGGECTYSQPQVGGNNTQRNKHINNGHNQHPVYNHNQLMNNAMCFGDKLICPHHGCAYDVKSGSVEYGPASTNLPIFSVREKTGTVRLSYPQKIPKGVNPRTVPRNYGDQRKVVILGEDHNATIGCVQGLRQFGYDGEISMIFQKPDIPYRKDMLHKSIPNLHLKPQQKSSPKIQQLLQSLLQQKIYSLLQFHPQSWYTQHGIQFVYNLQPYRIIHKRFYPYLTFFDGVKKQYDGLVIATDVKPMVYQLEGLTSHQGRDQNPANVFMPFRNKEQHAKLVKFLNINQVKNMIVLGLDQFTLEFLNALRTNFPQIKVQVLDTQKENKLFQLYGEQLSLRILQQYTQRDMQFYMKIDSPLKTSNTMINNSLSNGVSKSKKKIANSITIEFGQQKQQTKLVGDCVVYFPQKYLGKTQNIRRKAKYTDIEFTLQQRIITQPTQRTDSQRIFSIGNVSQSQYYFTKSRLSSFNPLIAYEQGFNCAFNLLALNIPFTYIPIQITNHFGKRLYHTGPQCYHNQMLVLGRFLLLLKVMCTFIQGSIKDWDFMIIYAKNNKIYSATASESRQKQLQVLRQAFRLQCDPQFQGLLNNQWDIPKLYKLIKKLNKSSCYRDQIHKIQDDPIKGLIVWVERKKGSGFANDKPNSEDQSAFQVDQRGYIREI